MAVTNIQILNAIRGASSQAYQDRIPEATRDNIITIGNAILEYEPTKNEFITNLVNKIGLTLIIKTESDNRFAKYTKTLEYGDTVEEIFISLFKAKTFNPNDENPFDKEIPDVEVIYHKIDRKIFYHATIEEYQLRSAFRSSTGVSDLITGIVDAMVQSKEYDDFLFYKELISTYSGYKHIKVDAVTNEATAKMLLFAIKQASSALTYRSTEYNAMGVNTLTPKSRQLLVIKSEVKNFIDLDYLAGIYNLTKAELETKIIEVDNFNEADDILALLVDEEIFRVYQNLYVMKTQENNKALYTNHFLHSWACYSLSKFMNAVKFSTADVPPNPEE